MITVITPVHDRPVAIELCKEWMARQTYKDFHWVVVNDGDICIADRLLEGKPDSISHIRRIHKNPEPGKITTIDNILCGVNAMEESPPKWSEAPVAIVEDDDWHGPTFLGDLYAGLEGFDICATCPYRVYNVKTRTYSVGRSDVERMVRKRCGTLSMSGIFRDPKVLKQMRKGARAFWRDAWRKYRINIVKTQFVAIKGLPGVAAGSRHDSMKGEPDPDLKVLKSWIGNEDTEKIMSVL